MRRFQNPERLCDLVMKGGVTSGILYPPAVCQIAERFHLVGIGGTSAGAIAACLAAAAEYRRRTRNDPDGFELLARVPDELSGYGRLLGLFRPDAKTQTQYDFLLEAAELSNRARLSQLWWKARAAVTFLLRREPFLRPILDNGYGLCTGMAQDNPPGTGEIQPLTRWLHAKIQEISGKPETEPLTFGDLWNAPMPEAFRSTMAGTGRSIDFRSVTTCITFGRPYELPFKDHIFAFDPHQFRRLFPEEVVAHMENRADEVETETRNQDGKLPLPFGEDLPVLVAARMSLSFPGLFTAVPLWAVDFESRAVRDGAPKLDQVWFSDGGLTSNLPIHRFDSLFPRWPTLGLNLQATDPDGNPTRTVVDESLVYMIQRSGDGTRDLWHRFDAQSTLGSLGGFGSALFRSARVWHDNAFLKLPGYRDRVAEIWLRPDEGGLNLKMSQRVVRGLIQRGDEAGRRLCQRFTDPKPNEPPKPDALPKPTELPAQNEPPKPDPLPKPNELSWDHHRWTRLRSGLAGLAVSLHGFRRSVEQPMPGDRHLSELLASPDAVPIYRFSEEQLAAARTAIDQLLELIAQMQEADVCPSSPDRPFCDGPKPAIEIGSRAPM